MKQKKFLRHHWFLVCVFAVILLLAVVAFILQRSTNLDVIAGEAIRQQIDETKQLALSDEAVKIAAAVKLGQKQVFIPCPPYLLPNEQHWKLPMGWDSTDWEFEYWGLVEVRCNIDSHIFCHYADGVTEIQRADELVISKFSKKLGKCVFAVGESTSGCNCDIKP